jgi:glycosyltransferase involved in cell wall biosynthesis
MSRTPGADVCCVIPCYNIEDLCGAVVREAAAHADRVLAVDDGSTDGTRAALRAAAQEGGGRVGLIEFETNRGKGAALLTAFHEALRDPGCRVVVTLDGDGQHRPADLPRLVAACREGADLVIGERLQLGKMPLRSRIGNVLTRGVLRRLHPRCPADTQSGFRAHSRAFAEEILRRIRGTRYELELRVLLLALTQRRRIATVPIPTLYIQGNRSSHFRPLADSIRIGAAILGWYLPARRADR